MPATPLRFRQRELVRAVKAMTAAGVEIERIEIDQNDGKIVIVPKGNKPDYSHEWDDLK
jgi:hypothetical protein